MDRITWEMCQSLSELLDNDLMTLAARLWLNEKEMTAAQHRQAAYWSKRVVAEGKRRNIKIVFSVL